MDMKHDVKSVQIPSFLWSVFSCILTEYRKIRIRKTPYLDTSQVVKAVPSTYAWKFIIFNKTLTFCNSWSSISGCFTNSLNNADTKTFTILLKVEVESDLGTSKISWIISNEHPCANLFRVNPVYEFLLVAGPWMLVLLKYTVKFF